LVAILGVQRALIITAVLFFFGVIASYLLRRGIILPGLFHMVGLVEREHEKELPGKGALIFFLGAIFLMLIFKEQLIVIGALCVAVYGDAASTLFGLRFGKHRIAGKKTIEGVLGGILVSLLFLGVLFEPWIALVTAITGMVSELLPFDDSFTIPLTAAIVLTLLL
tara:strand:+ start:356 stop:853 length:498 start_codon:yes stop_codon:yes gene_type:complete